MSSNQTTNYQLHQWEPTDDFLREEINENFALLDGASRVVTGSYTGDGTTDRFIDLGFTPKAVLLVNNLGEMGFAGNSQFVHGGLLLPGTQLQNLAAIVEGGFTASYQSYFYSVNDQGKGYYYLAVR